MEKLSIATIGGSAFEKLTMHAEQTQLETPYGIDSHLYNGEIERTKTVSLQKHGSNHSTSPYKTNHWTSVDTLHKLGAQKIVTNVVGATIRDFIRFGKLLIETNRSLSIEHKDACQRNSALKNARIK